jgi:hypothetical protein
MTRTLTTCSVLLLAATAARGQSEDVPPRQLTLHPAAPSARALRYPLLPELRDQKPGNAAVRYKKAIELLPKPLSEDEFAQTEKWREVPLKDLPLDDVRKFLKRHEAALRETEAAARCEQCDWGLNERIKKAGIGVLTPEVQPMRTLGMLLSLRARLELAEGQPDRALHTVQAGLAAARHVGDAPTPINGLVGIALATMMADRLEEIVQHPKAPSLYWSLTDLPRPFLDLRKPLQGERVMVYGTFPGMAEVAADPNKVLSPEQIKKLADFLVNDKEIFGIGSRTVLAFLLIQRHETSKKALIQRGWPRDKVEAMPHLQVALLHSLGDYDQLLDEVLKWQSFPFWEARPGLEQADRLAREARVKAIDRAAGTPALPLAPLLMPAVQKVLNARTRLDRRFAALRCLEVVRLYAVGHGGKLPATLSDVKEVPVPVDPVTGKGFDYKVRDGKATLTAPPLPGETPSLHNTVHYEITVKR